MAGFEGLSALVPGDGLGVGVGLGDGVGLGVGVGLGDGVGLGVGDGLGAGDGLGEGCRSAWLSPGEPKNALSSLKRRAIITSPLVAFM